MQISEFCFSPERKKILSGLLSKVKSRLQAGRVQFFLSECEREIKSALSVYPAGWNTDERIPKRLEAVGKAALALKEAMYKLNEAECLALFARVLVGDESGVDIREARAEARETENLLLKISQISYDLIQDSRAPVKDRPGEDIAYAVAVSYVVAFGALPSLRHDSVYKSFVDEITENDLPEGFRCTIGKRKMEMANKRANVHLECLQLNTTVTDKTQ